MVPCDCAKIKPGYYGDRCENRDCKLSKWSSWTTCKDDCPLKNCDLENCPTLNPMKNRERRVVVKKAGEGKCVGDLTDSDSCGFRCLEECDDAIHGEE